MHLVVVRVLAVLAILWLAGSAVAEREILHPRRWDDGPTPASKGMKYSDVSFHTADGLTLRGWWIPGTEHKTIVMVHGWTSSRRETFGKAGYLHDAGYNLLVFDLRGHGISDGTGTTMGYREPLDARAAVAEARSLDPGPIALFGYSLGGAISVEDASFDPNVTALVEDSAFSSLSGVLASDFDKAHVPVNPFGDGLEWIGQMDLGVPITQITPLLSAEAMHKPALAIVDGADQTVPPEQGLALFNAFAGPKQILYLPGVNHTGGYDHARALYESTVLGFLQTNL